MEFIVFDLHGFWNIEGRIILFRGSLAQSRAGLRIRRVRAEQQPGRNGRNRQRFYRSHSGVPPSLSITLHHFDSLPDVTIAPEILSFSRTA